MQDFKSRYYSLYLPLDQMEEPFSKLSMLVSQKNENIYRIYNDIKRARADIERLYYNPDRPKPKAPLFEQFMDLWCEKGEQNTPVTVEEIKNAQKLMKRGIYKLIARNYVKYGVPKIKPELTQMLTDIKSPLFPMTRFYLPEEIAEVTNRLKQQQDGEEYYDRGCAFAEDASGNHFMMFGNGEGVDRYNPQEKLYEFAGNPSHHKHLREKGERYAELWLSQYTSIKKPLPNPENFRKLAEPIQKLQDSAKAWQNDEHFGRYQSLFQPFAETVENLSQAYLSANKDEK